MPDPLMSPAITVAVPLHASAPWVENIVANVRALPPIVTEIIISDHTCIDNAAEQLRDRLSDDPRIVVHAKAAGLGFVEHYNLLMDMGHGELFMWMPHDDIFDPGWVPVLAEALQAYPRAWLAFGQMRSVKIDGVTPAFDLRFPFSTGQLSGWDSLMMMLAGLSYIPFRGLFRRQKILAAELKLESEKVLLAIDNDWVFAVAVHSALVYDERAVCWKRHYPNSTHRSPSWPRSRCRSDEAAVALLRRHGPRGLPGMAMRSTARLHGLVFQMRRRVAQLLPSRFKKATRQAISWLLRLF